MISSNRFYGMGKVSTGPVHRKTSSLPSLKQDHGLKPIHNLISKPKIVKYSVGKSDLDCITSPNICFCSVSQKIDNCHQNLVDLNYNLKEFEPNRPNEYQALFNEKCHQCEIVLINNTKQSDLYNKKLDDKNKVLQQLIKTLEYPLLVRKITKTEVESVVTLFSNNIFREYPPISSFPPSILFDIIESFRDEAWPQFSLIFDFFFKIVTATHIDPKILNSAINPSFVKSLFNCFASPDDRERKATLELTYAIACRLPDRCPNIFSFISNSLQNSINDEPIHWGLPQILELMSKISLNMPQFSFKNVDSNRFFGPLISLHQLNNFISFHQQLFLCLEMILTCHQQYVSNLLNFLISHFPVASQTKQILFMNEIHIVVTKFWQAISPCSVLKLFFLIGSLFESPCVDVSAKALSMIYEEGFPQLVNQYYSQAVPFLFPPAKRASKHHWDQSIILLAVSFVHELSKMNPNAFNTIVSRSISSLSRNEEVKQNWELIKNMAENQNNPHSPPSSTQQSQNLKYSKQQSPSATLSLSELDKVHLPTPRFNNKVQKSSTSRIKGKITTVKRHF